MISKNQDPEVAFLNCILFHKCFHILSLDSGIKKYPSPGDALS